MSIKEAFKFSLAVAFNSSISFLEPSFESFAIPINSPFSPSILFLLIFPIKPLFSITFSASSLNPSFFIARQISPSFFNIPLMIFELNNTSEYKNMKPSFNSSSHFYYYIHYNALFR